MIRYGQQNITDSDIQSVIEVLKSVNLTQGPTITQFEQAVAHYVNAKYAIAVNSATSALHIACLALGLGKEDWLWTTPNSFVASANCALYCGAQVDFVDIDPQTYNLSVTALKNKLEQAKKDGKLPKVLIPVHLCGQSCQMQAIKELSTQYGFKIIEDASHAIGGSYLGKKIGNGEFSDITIFSFHPVKIITTGEGGMALTNHPELATKLGLLRSHGITRDPELMTQPMDGPWYYQQVDLGFNYRMTDIQAALGLSQMKRIDTFVKRRHQVAQMYNHLLSDLPVTLPFQHPDTYSAYHLYVIRLKLDKITKTHLEVFNYLRSHDIIVNLHYIPIHTQPYYKQFGFKQGDFPNAEQYYREAISIPMHPSLSDQDVHFVVDRLKEILT